MIELQIIKNKIQNLDYNDVQSAEEIRVLVRNAKSLTGEADNDLDRAIQIAISAYKKKTPERILTQIKTNENLAKYLSIFVGDKTIGNWNYFNSDVISDDEAKALLVPLSKYTIPHDELRVFIKTFFLERRREIWMEAAKALAILSTRDKLAKNYLMDLWKQRFPGDMGKKWFTNKTMHDGDKISDPKDIIIHEARHVFYAVSCYYSLTKVVTDFPGYDLKEIEKIGFPSDESACSIVISSLAVLWSVKEFRNTILNILKKYLVNTKKTLLIENSIRGFFHYKDIQSSAEEIELHNLLTNYLIDTALIYTNNKYNQTIDLIISWVKSIKLLSQSSVGIKLDDYFLNLPDEFKEISTLALEDITIPGSKNYYLNQLISKLSALLNINIWETNTLLENSLNIASALLLSEKKELAGLPIKYVVGLTGIPNDEVLSLQTDGSLDKNIYAFLLIHLLELTKEKDITPRIFFTEKQYDERIVFRLSSIDNGYISIQVALQIEYLLRTKNHSLEQIRFLWRLLVYNPQSKVFLELLKVIRGDNSPLHELVNVLYDLDKKRDDNTESVSDFIRGYNLLAGSIKKLLGEPGIEKNYFVDPNLQRDSENLVSMLENISEQFQSTLVYDPGKTIQLIMVIKKLEEWLGSGENSLLIKWFKHLTVDLGGLETAWRYFIDSYKEVVSLQPFLSDKQLSGLEQSLINLEKELQRVTWPELKILSSFSEVIRNWIKELYAMREKSHLLNTELMNIAENKKDINLLKSSITELLSNETNLELILPDTIRAVHQFLQFNLEYGLSEELRNNKYISDKVKLNSFFKFISPLLIGVLAGPFLVLDIGSVWAELVIEGRQLYYNLTVVMALFISLIMFYLNFFSNTIFDSGIKSRFIRIKKIFAKGILVYIISFIIAFITSSMVLYTLSGTSLTSELTTLAGFLKLSLLWSSLSLLFGWFIGLILQGRKILND